MIMQKNSGWVTVQVMHLLVESKLFQNVNLCDYLLKKVQNWYDLSAVHCKYGFK